MEEEEKLVMARGNLWGIEGANDPEGFGLTWYWLTGAGIGLTGFPTKAGAATLEGGAWTPCGLGWTGTEKAGAETFWKVGGSTGPVPHTEVAFDAGCFCFSFSPLIFMDPRGGNSISLFELILVMLDLRREKGGNG